MHRRVWEDVPADEASVRLTSSALGVHPVIARLLCQRGLTDPDDARRFLEPALEGSQVSSRPTRTLLAR